jgi:hypothetical protein
MVRIHLNVKYQGVEAIVLSVAHHLSAKDNVLKPSLVVGVVSLVEGIVFGEIFVDGMIGHLQVQTYRHVTQWETATWMFGHGVSSSPQISTSRHRAADIHRTISNPNLRH